MDKKDFKEKPIFGKSGGGKQGKFGDGKKAKGMGLKPKGSAKKK